MLVERFGVRLAVTLPRHPDGRAAHPPARGHRPRHRPDDHRRQRGLDGRGARAGQRLGAAGAPAGGVGPPGGRATPCTCRTTCPRPTSTTRLSLRCGRFRRSPGCPCRTRRWRTRPSGTRADIIREVGDSEEVARVVAALEQQYDTFLEGRSRGSLLAGEPSELPSADELGRGVRAVPRRADRRGADARHAERSAGSTGRLAAWTS